MKNELIERTKKLAIRIIEFCEKYPHSTKYFVIEQQLIKSAT